MIGTVIIPARYASVRLAGKPLLRFAGRSLLEHTWLAAAATGLEVWIATDDPRIEAEATRIGARWILTSAECANGTERCAEAARRLDLAGPILNWQGDSPLVPPQWAHQLLASLRSSSCVVATPVQRCSLEQQARIRRDYARSIAGATTAAMNEDFEALYFSKAPIPSGGPLWLHVGMYAYTAEALAAYGTRAGLLEQSEHLEQLRFLERGLRIQCMPVDGPPIWEVNNFGDLAVVERMMGERDAALRN